MKASVILACGGSSSRMGGINKLFCELDSIPVIIRTAMQFDSVDEVCEIIFSVSESNKPLLESALKKYRLSKPYMLVSGGSTRQQSVFNAFSHCQKSDVICVHDGARPLISQSVIRQNILDAYENDCAVVCVPVKDTIKLASGKVITATTNRPETFAAQTPQSARYDIYRNAVMTAQESNADYTDDSQLFEAAGLSPLVTLGEYTNIKITTIEDLDTAKSFLNKDKGNAMNLRIGHGYDVHRLGENRRLILGGVDIEHSSGLIGHSDADVLTHAIMDALLGAAALGDIGRLFPDTDEKYKGADSLVLLAEVCRRLRENGFEIVNIDATICAQAPKISPHYEKMRENIARVCNIGISQVSVKATTEEGLGFTGEKKGISATAVAMLVN